MVIPIVFFSILAFLPTPTSAHNFPCGHDHLPGPAGQVFMENTCSGDTAACDAGCVQVTTRNNRSYCSCGIGDCETVFAGTFVDWNDKALEPETERSFYLGTETIEALSVWVANIEVASFGPSADDTLNPDDTEALDGVVTIDIGSFDNPEAIPIMVTDLYVELASLVGDAKESGTTTIQLRHGRPVAMLFDLVHRQFRLADPGAIGVKLQLQNELAGNQPAVMYLDGKLDTQDNLSIFGQLTVDMDQTAVLRASWGLAKSFLGHDATAEGGRD